MIAKKLSEYKLNEGDTLVMMSMKAKVVNVQKEEEKKKRKIQIFQRMKKILNKINQKKIPKQLKSLKLSQNLNKKRTILIKLSN